MTSKYLLEKLVRHGPAAQRLADEMDHGSGEFHNHTESSAVAFDAADLVWTFLTLRGHEEAEESRELRNHVAQEIIKALENYEWLQSTE